MHAVLSRLVAYARWADARTADSLRALPDPPPDALRLFAHLCRAESARLARIRGEDPDPAGFWPARSPDEALAEASRAADGLDALLASDESLVRLARYRRSSGGTVETPVWELVADVATHGEHHRGQIARIVRDAGGDPAVTDFLAFSREHPAVTSP